MCLRNTRKILGSHFGGFALQTYDFGCGDNVRFVPGSVGGKPCPSLPLLQRRFRIFVVQKVSKFACVRCEKSQLFERYQKPIVFIIGITMADSLGKRNCHKVSLGLFFQLAVLSKQFLSLVHSNLFPALHTEQSEFYG